VHAAGGGPTFLQAATYRIRGHLEAEALLLGGGRYREEDEVEQWRGRDPLAGLAAHLTSAAQVSPEVLDALAARVAARVEDAASFAEASEPADPELVHQLMFAGQEP